MCDSKKFDREGRKPKKRILSVENRNNAFCRIALPLTIMYVAEIFSTVGSSNHTCATSECVAASELVLKNMDKNVDPCVDFYEFACGKFVKGTPMPKHRTYISTMDMLEDSLSNQLKEIFDEPIAKTDIKPYKLLKGFYQACMKGDENGLKPIQEVLKQLGGWPVLSNDWNEKSFSWQNTIHQFRQIGFDDGHFLKFSVENDFKFPYLKTLAIDQISFDIDRSCLIEGRTNAIVDAYYKYMIEVAVTFGAERICVDSELQESLNFEIELAKITTPEDERRNLSKLYNPMTISTLQREYPSISWLQYVDNIIAPTPNNLTELDLLVIKNPQYISSLEKLLKDTPKRIIANYAFWRAVSSSIPFLTEELRNRRLEFEAVLFGKTEREPRWKECFNIVADKYPQVEIIMFLEYGLANIIGAFYVKRYFPPESKEDVQNLVNRIRLEAFKTISSAKWIMDNSTRYTYPDICAIERVIFTYQLHHGEVNHGALVNGTKALEKIFAMTAIIGYQETILDSDALEEYYAKLEVDQNQFFMSHLNLSKFEANEIISDVMKAFPKNRMNNRFDPASIYAGYKRSENKLLLSSGILQPPLYSKGRPSYLNFGHIGTIIGHEITHPFDDKGSQYDKDGALSEWRDPATKQRFLEKTECFANQYSNYMADEVKIQLNGLNTVGENIADNGGTKLAYNSYRQWSAKHGPEPKLPNLLEYSNEQMFWISAATTHCSKYTPERLKSEIIGGQYAPARFRVIGSLSNNEDFARDFNCPLGSNMNPNHKCNLW